jgi:hypothetical protein
MDDTPAPELRTSMDDERQNREANRLYWETQVSVAEIADRLIMSRRALYDAIQPRPAARECSECGGGLVYRNRTSFERRQAECLECEIVVAVGAGGTETSGTEPQVEQARAAARLSPMARRPTAPAGDGGKLAGTLLAGIALGTAAGYLLRRR